MWHIYIGKAPRDYVDMLELPEDVVLYRSPSRWFFRAFSGLSRNDGGAFVSNPGEISSTRTEFILGAMSAVLLGVGRLFGNPGFRVGIGARDRKRPWSLGHEIATRLAALNVWRDAASQRAYGRGALAPDWAFFLDQFTNRENRDAVALSYRSDKALPTDNDLNILVEWCNARELELIVVTQVSRDFSSNAKMARRLGVRHIAVPDGSLAEVEASVRAVYARSVLVLSNRIHVLIIAAIDGACPGAILGHDDVKIERTLAAGHLSERVLGPGSTPLQMRRFLDRLAGSAQEVAFAVEQARADLREVAQDVLGRAQRRRG
ncbi:hypothetical protein [Microbacterium tumbae]